MVVQQTQVIDDTSSKTADSSVRRCIATERRTFEHLWEQRSRLTTVPGWAVLFRGRAPLFLYNNISHETVAAAAAHDLCRRRYRPTGRANERELRKRFRFPFWYHAYRMVAAVITPARTRPTQFVREDYHRSDDLSPYAICSPCTVWSNTGKTTCLPRIVHSRGTSRSLTIGRVYHGVSTFVFEIVRRYKFLRTAAILFFFVQQQRFLLLQLGLFFNYPAFRSI